MPWSGIGVFYTGNPFQSAMPLSPSNQAMDQPTSLAFTWRRAKDQEPYTKFELSTSPDFSYYNYLNYTTDSSLTVNTNIYPNGQYYWRVTTTHYFNNRYYEVTSPTFTFYTYVTNNVALIAPAQGAYATGTSPNFLWGLSPAVSHYLFQISDNNFNTLISEQVVDTNEYTLPYTLADNKYYYWRVGAVENQNTTWSETRNFYTGDPFQPITLLQPGNQASDQPLTLDFRWKRSFTNKDFKFQLSDSEDFSTVLYEQSLSDTILTVQHLEPSQLYFWRILNSRTFNESSFTIASPTYSFITTAITGIGNPLAEGHLVGYPNPFNQEVSIEFYSSQPGEISLSIIDSFGSEVKQFTRQVKNAGFVTVSWNGINDRNEQLAAGVYFVVLHSKAQTEQIKLVLTK
ncbi:MAG TPA: T9SS type A sorting domain-containing protein [Cyclobacteriaceae bacterium]|nr:T9SS type A sorting domain-containing protein [Cyclobacteriaceae bacterium]